jgi:thiamine-phosphate pyrophosphorylase
MTREPGAARRAPDVFYPILPDAGWIARLVPLGIRTVQLRLKDAPDAEVHRQIAASLDACRRHGCDLVVNDYWRVAIELGASAVHLGQEDLAGADVAALRAAGIALGVSTHSEDELETALAAAPDYVALGPIYETKLKVMRWAPQGLERLTAWKERIGALPLVAIGGITPERAPGVLAAGADSVAVITDFMTHADRPARVRTWLAWAAKSRPPERAQASAASAARRCSGDAWLRRAMMQRDETSMAYRFKLDEHFAKGFCRIGRGQIERAGTELARGSGRARAVHEARKALKRLRALLRLVRPALGEAAFHRENTRLRDIARGFAGEREFDVLLETITKLEARPEAESLGKALAAIKSEVGAARASHHCADDAKTTKEALTRLAAARGDFARLELDGEGFALVGKGLARGYRRGRKAFATAYENESDEAFHELRKAVQLHWRHMGLLTRAWPELLAARIAAAKRLSQMLGDDHDLAVFADFAQGLAPEKVPAKEVAAVVRLARRRQQELRTTAKPLLAQLYAEGKRGFVRRLALYWSAAQQSAGLETREPGPSPDPPRPPPKSRRDRRSR